MSWSSCVWSGGSKQGFPNKGLVWIREVMEGRSPDVPREEKDVVKTKPRHFTRRKGEPTMKTVALTRAPRFNGPHLSTVDFICRKPEKAFSGNRSHSKCFLYVACITRGRYLVVYLTFSFFTKIIIKMTMGL